MMIGRNRSIISYAVEQAADGHYDLILQDYNRARYS